MQRMVVLAALASAAAGQLIRGACIQERTNECQEYGDLGATCQRVVRPGQDTTWAECQCSNTATFGQAAPGVDVCVNRTNGIVNRKIPVSIYARYTRPCSAFDDRERGEFKRVVESVFDGTIEGEVIYACSNDDSPFVAAEVFAEPSLVERYIPTTVSLTDALDTAHNRRLVDPILGSNVGRAPSDAKMVIDRECRTNGRADLEKARRSVLDVDLRCQPTVCIEGHVLERTYTEAWSQRQYNQWECVPIRPPMAESDDDLTDAEIAVIVVGAVLLLALLGVLFMVACTASNDAPSESKDADPEAEPVAEPVEE